jgi:two-component system, chemotaxis family, sensor kinase CheA
MEYDMIQKRIEEQIERLSCDLILADPQEPESLSGLLPILKQIHGNCMKLSLKETATMILKARKIIDSLLEDNPKDIEQKMSALNDLVSEIASSINTLKQSEQDPQIDDSVQNSSEPTNDTSYPEPEEDQIKKTLNDFATLIRGFCPGSIPDLGQMLNTLDKLIELSKEQNFNTLLEIAAACKEYVGQMTLEENHNTKPIEEGLLLLKSILNYEKKGEVFGFDYSDVLDLLNINPEEAQKTSEKQEPKEQKPKMEKPNLAVRIYRNCKPAAKYL